MTQQAYSAPSSRVSIHDPDSVRRIVENAKARGVIKAPPGDPAIPKFDPAALAETAAAAKAAGLIREPGVARRIAKIGQEAAALGGIQTLWMYIDPVRAKEWLENCFHNRALSEDTIVAYTRDMLAGIWPETHQGIAFNDRDELIDGQHRLHAVIRSGVTIHCMVTFGLPSKIKGREMTTMDAIDRGRPRSVADQLKIQHNLKHGTIIAAVCASLANLCNSERTRKIGVGHTLEIYRAWQPAIDWLIERRSKANGLRSAGVLAAFAFAGDGEEAHRAAICRMYDDLIEGAQHDGLCQSGDLDPRSPIKLLRDFLTAPEAQLLNRGSDRALAELVLQAIDLALSGAAIEKLEMSQDGLNHFRAMQSDRVAKIAALFTVPTPSGK